MTNTASPLTITGIGQSGGAVVVTDTGVIDITGTVSGSSDVTLQSSAAITEMAGGSIDTRGAASAVVLSAGSGGGAGTLMIDGNVYGANLTLQGADVDIGPTANVGSANGIAPTVSTFVSSGLDAAEGLAFDSAGNLYVANFGNNTIRKVTPAGVVSTFVDNTQGLVGPDGLAFDSAGNLYVANEGINTISKVTPAGAVSTFISTGLNDPTGLAFDSAGNLYVSNTGLGSGTTVSEFNSSGASVNPTFASGLNGPAGLAFDASGNLYVANTTGNTISEFNSSGTSVKPTFASGLNYPFSLAFDSAGNLYVANEGFGSGTTVSEFSSSGTLVNAAFASGLNGPFGLAFDSYGTLYVSNVSVSNISQSTISEVTPAIPATTSVTFQSSVESRPMEIGGSNNNAVNGINLISRRTGSHRHLRRRDHHLRRQQPDR